MSAGDVPDMRVWWWVTSEVTSIEERRAKSEPRVELTVEEVVYWLVVVGSTATITNPGARPVIERDRANCLKLGLMFARGARRLRSDGIHDWEREALVAAWLYRQACLAIDREGAR